MIVLVYFRLYGSRCCFVVGRGSRLGRWWWWRSCGGCAVAVVALAVAAAVAGVVLADEGIL